MTSETSRIRSRTAMRRRDLSIPAQHLLNSGVVSPRDSYLDYGCGRGDDVNALKAMGWRARGWDPVHRPSTKLTKSDFVGCFYVINVIDDPAERESVIASAWKLCTKALLVSARLIHDQDEAHIVPRGDGWITSTGTFQKFFEHDELGALISHATGTQADAIAPGIFIVFRSESLRQDWKARRLRSPNSPRLVSKSSQAMAENSALLEPMINFVLSHGRLPTGTETAEFANVIAQFGSLKQAFHVVVRSTDREAWKQSAIERSVDLLAFLALAQFDGIDRMGLLPDALQRDVRAHFGSFKSAYSKANQLLFSSGNPVAVDIACRASSIGKLTPTALYLHKSGIPLLPALLRVVLGCGQRLIGDITEANVIKIFRSQPYVSYLEYPDFDTDAHPWLNKGWHLDLLEQRLKSMSFGNRTNRPILHRIHEFLPRTDPRFESLKNLTEQEVAAGYFANPSLIGTEEGWAAAIEAASDD